MKLDLQDFFLTISSGEVSDFTVSSAHKLVMRGRFIRQSAFIKQRYQTTLLECHKQIALVTVQNKQVPTPALASKLGDLFQDLTTLNAQKTKYFLQRLLATTYHNSGKPFKYLANRLRTQHTATRITDLVGKDVGKIMNTTDIVQEFAHFCKQLYSLNIREGVTVPTPFEST
ncbi:Hypothetical predicted protein [Pelobates cultripes]|uniref:Uncharacterized protein n=1 Tax=Pelobates cultripes TaxID=61616 RepID=A0AAD1RSX1_PELCU|nr:Hypothetical predicted protein [Pelobates cultripes]